MALMSPQAVSSVLEPTFAAVNSSDTIGYTSGLLLYVKVGGTTTTVTLVVPGNQVYSGVAKDDVAVASLQNEERVFRIDREAVDAATNLATVTYSQTTAVTAALLKI
jgi:hypothetical protein